MKNSVIDVAIIGAGTAGTFAANQLTAAGLHCSIVEKSRGLGGRCSRRNVLDDYSIDLGAASFSLPYIDHPNIIKNLHKWLKAGFIEEWLFSSNDFEAIFPCMKKVELCGSPSMNALHRHLAEGVNCLTQQTVHELKRRETVWQLLDGSGQLIIEAKAVIVTAPAEQTHNLVAPYNLCGEHKQQSDPILTASQSSRPQYICAIAFEQPQTHLCDVYSGKHAVFSKAIRANSKPGKRHSSDEKIPEIWVLHSTYEWAKEQQHKDAQSVAKEMARLFCQHFNIPVADTTDPVKIVASHYWRLADHDHATIKKSFGQNNDSRQPFLWDANLKLGCSADWLAGGGIAGALNSSQELCNHITSQLKKRHNG